MLSYSTRYVSMILSFIFSHLTKKKKINKTIIIYHALTHANASHFAGVSSSINNSNINIEQFSNTIQCCPPGLNRMQPLTFQWCASGRVSIRLSVYRNVQTHVINIIMNKDNASKATNKYSSDTSARYTRPISRYIYDDDLVSNNLRDNK